MFDDEILDDTIIEVKTEKTNNKKSNNKKSNNKKSINKKYINKKSYSEIINDDILISPDDTDDIINNKILENITNYNKYYKKYIDELKNNILIKYDNKYNKYYNINYNILNSNINKIIYNLIKDFINNIINLINNDYFKFNNKKQYINYYYNIDDEIIYNIFNKLYTFENIKNDDNLKNIIINIIYNIIGLINNIYNEVINYNKKINTLYKEDILYNQVLLFFNDKKNEIEKDILNIYNKLSNKYYDNKNITIINDEILYNKFLLSFDNNETLQNKINEYKRLLGEFEKINYEQSNFNKFLKNNKDLKNYIKKIIDKYNNNDNIDYKQFIKYNLNSIYNDYLKNNNLLNIKFLNILKEENKILYNLSSNFILFILCKLIPYIISNCYEILYDIIN